MYSKGFQTRHLDVVNLTSRDENRKFSLTMALRIQAPR